MELKFEIQDEEPLVFQALVQVAENNIERTVLFSGLNRNFIYLDALLQGQKSEYGVTGIFECLPCPEGCEQCEDDRPCVVSLNWVMRTAILVLSCVIICCLPIVVVFTWKYGNVKVS